MGPPRNGVAHPQFLKEAAVCYEAAGTLDEKNPLWLYLHGLVLQVKQDPRGALVYIGARCDLSRTCWKCGCVTRTC